MKGLCPECETMHGPTDPCPSQGGGRVSAWQPIETAPKDGTVVRLKTKDGRMLRASFQWGLENGLGDECGAWFAEDEYEQPPSWTDGICWASNEDEVPSDPPTNWMPDPPKDAGTCAGAEPDAAERGRG